MGLPETVGEAPCNRQPAEPPPNTEDTEVVISAPRSNGGQPSAAADGNLSTEGGEGAHRTERLAVNNTDVADGEVVEEEPDEPDDLYDPSNPDAEEDLEARLFQEYEDRALGESDWFGYGDEG